MSGDSVWMSEWVQHPFRLHEPVDAHCREEVQGAAEWWRTGASSPPGGTAAVASGDTKSDDNVATTVFISAAAASSTATAKCIGHDWESSSNEDSPYQQNHPRGQMQSTPWVPHDHRLTSPPPAASGKSTSSTVPPRDRSASSAWYPVASRVRR